MTKHRQKQGFNPMRFVAENTALSAGTAVGFGVTSSIVGATPSAAGANLLSSMQPMSMIPLAHASGGLIQSVNELNRKPRRRK